MRLKLIEAGHLLGTFEYQPSLVGTRSPNREGVIGPSLVIGKTSSRSNRHDSISRETNAHPSVQWASCSVGLLWSTTALSCFSNISSSRFLFAVLFQQSGTKGSSDGNQTLPLATLKCAASKTRSETQADGVDILFGCRVSSSRETNRASNGFASFRQVQTSSLKNILEDSEVGLRLWLSGSRERCAAVEWSLSRLADC